MATTATSTNDRLSSVAEAGFSTEWDFQGSYVSSLAEDGYERFSQYSATPDSTLLFAGPARFTGLAGDSSELTPIGLTDNIQMQSDAGLARLFEIGSNRSFFTRGKTSGTFSLTKLLADQGNILHAMSANAYRPAVADAGYSAPGADGSNIMMNLDSPYFACPMGILMVMKTRGGGDSGYGKALAAIYIEYAMFQGLSMSIVSTQPVISEGVSISYDRIVPVSFN